jgi:hypothetical protein
MPGKGHHQWHRIPATLPRIYQRLTLAFPWVVVGYNPALLPRLGKPLTGSDWCRGLANKGRFPVPVGEIGSSWTAGRADFWLTWG